MYGVLYTRRCSDFLRQNPPAVYSHPSSSSYAPYSIMCTLASSLTGQTSYSRKADSQSVISDDVVFVHSGLGFLVLAWWGTLI